MIWLLRGVNPRNTDDRLLITDPVLREGALRLLLILLLGASGLESRSPHSSIKVIG
jgi:hypothetical protein